MRFRVKLGNVLGIESAQPVLVDQVVANHAVLGAVAQFDVKRKRLQQLIALQGREKAGALAIAFVELSQHFADLLEEWGWTAARFEEQHTFSRARYARMIHIDVQLNRRVTIFGAPNKERLNSQRQRLVISSPTVSIK